MEAAYTLLYRLGNALHKALWVRVLQRIANTGKKTDGMFSLLFLQRYPALLMLYAGGVAAVDAQHYDTLAALFSEPRLPIIVDSRIYRFPCVGLMPPLVFTDQAVDALPRTGYPSVESNHILELLRPAFRGLIPEEERYERSFERFEALLMLSASDVQLNLNDYRVNYLGGLRAQLRQIRQIDGEAERDGDTWAPLKGGLFSGSIDRYRAAYKGLLT